MHGSDYYVNHELAETLKRNIPLHERLGPQEAVLTQRMSSSTPEPETPLTVGSLMRRSMGSGGNLPKSTLRRSENTSIDKTPL